MNVVPISILLVLPALALLAWWLLCLIEALKYSDGAWEAVGQSKVVFVLLMVFLGVFGTIAYVVVARPALRQVPA